MPRPDPSVMIPPPLAGVRADLDYLDLGETDMRSASNWLRRGGRLMTRPGIMPVQASDPIGEIPTSIIQYTHEDETGRIVVATVDGWHHWDGAGGWTDITGNALTGTRSSPTVFRTIEIAGIKYLLGTNGVDTPKKWNGTDATYSDFGGSAPSAKALVTSFNRVVLGNLTSGPNASPQAIDVSEYENVDAGWGGGVQTRFLSDTDGAIVTMESLGNRKFAVYLEDGIYLATAIGTNESFRFDLHQKGVPGPVAPLALVPTPYGHIYLALDGTLRSFNGSTLQVIQQDVSDDRIHAYLRETMSFDEKEVAWLAYDPYFDELHVRYITVGDDTLLGGFILNMSDLSLWPIRFPNHELCAGTIARIVSSILYRDVVGTYAEQTISYADFDQTRNRVIAVNDDGVLYEFNGDDDYGFEIEHYFETGLRYAGDPRQKFVLRNANHLIEPTSDSGQLVEVKFGASQSGEPRVFEEPTVITLDTYPRETHHRLRGSMFSMHLSGAATAPIEYRGSQIVADPMGYR